MSSGFAGDALSRKGGWVIVSRNSLELHMALYEEQVDRQNFQTQNEE